MCFSIERELGPRFSVGTIATRISSLRSPSILEVVFEPGGPQHVGPQPAAVQREQGVGHQRDSRARRELEAEGPVDQVVTLVREGRDIVGTLDRQALGSRTLHPQLAHSYRYTREQA